MEFKSASLEDYEIAFDFIQKLWTYNTYDKKQIYKIYREILSDSSSFAFFVIDKGEYRGFCHGDFFLTFWMSGMTCYISSLITRECDRGKGYGKSMLDHVKQLAAERDCKAITLDSGMPRAEAHEFYERYGFEKSCYGFEYAL